MSVREFAERLNSLRQRSGLSYEALGRAAHVGRSSVHRYCTGSKVPQSFSIVEALAMACSAPRREIDVLYGLWTRVIAEQETAHQRTGREAGKQTEPPHAPPLPAQPPTLQAQAQAQQVRPTELPAQLAAFTGRGAELEAIESWLGESGPASALRIAVVSGPGGSGKSALAVQAANAVAGRFPGGQLFADLHGTSPGVKPLEPVEVLGRFLRSLGASETPADEEEAAGRFRSLAAGRRLLMVLDNAADAAQIRPLLPGTPDCGVIVTSRRRLTSLGEACRLQLGPLPDSDATALFTRLAGPGRVDDRDAAAEIVRLCGQLPLAVCIAAARLAARPSWPARALADRLAAEQRRLDELQAEDRAVRASLAMSYAELAGEAAQVFRHLGLLRGRDAAVPVVAALADTEERQAEMLLDELVDAQLAESPEPGRYRMHDLVRLFAGERATAEDAPPARSAALRRALHAYLATARNATALLDPGAAWRTRSGPKRLPHPGLTLTTHREVNAWVDAERVNLLAATRQAAAAPADGAALAAGLAAALYVPLRHRGWWRELRQLAEIAVEAAGRTKEPRNLAVALQDLGAARSSLGDPSPDVLNRALNLWREAGDQLGEARTRVLIAAIDRRRGDFAAAGNALDACLATFRRHGDRYGEAECLSQQGLLHQRAGRLDDALAAYTVGLAVCGKISDPGKHASALGGLAQYHRAAGNQEKAFSLYEEALGIARESGRSFSEAKYLWGLGLALHDAGQTAAAAECRERSAAILHHLGLLTNDDPRAMPSVLAGQLR